VTDLTLLFLRHGRVEALRLDEEYTEHQQQRGTYRKHHVTGTEILEAHANNPKYFENRGRAPLAMIGVTDAGRVLAVPIEPTKEYGVWRPVTAFEANTHHRERYYGGEP